MKKIFLFIIVLPLFASGQLVTTVAGNGTFGYFGDGYPATAAEIMRPGSVAIDKSGNFYFGDNSLIIIRKVDAAGIITKVAGAGVGGYLGDGGAATQAQLDGVSCIVFDDSGAMYVADANNNVIRKINTSGIITTVAGNGYGAGGVFGGFSGDNGPATAARMFDPSSVAIDKQGNLYISDTRNYRIRKVDTNGIITTIAGNGVGIYSGDGGQATAASLMYPTCLALDTGGNIYFQDNNHIRRITLSGHISTVVGYGPAGFSGDGGPGFTAQMDGPSGLTIDSAGNMYIADTHNERVRKVDAATGIINTIAGTGIPGYSGDGGPAIAARFSSPSGIALDATGALYIADAQNNRVRKMNTGMTLQVPMEPATLISMYPDPVSSELTISSTNKISSLAISDLSGHPVATSQRQGTGEKVRRINVEALSVGVYLVRINGTEVRRFVKE